MSKRKRIFEDTSPRENHKKQRIYGTFDLSSMGNYSENSFDMDDYLKYMYICKHLYYMKDIALLKYGWYMIQNIMMMMVI